MDPQFDGVFAAFCAVVVQETFCHFVLLNLLLFGQDKITNFVEKNHQDSYMNLHEMQAKSL